MSLEKIIETILADARSEAEKIIQESRSRAEAVRSNARLEAEGLAAEVLRESERQARLEASRLVTQARLEKKINILAKKREMIDRVLASAFEKSPAEETGLKKIVVLGQGEKEEALGRERLMDELRAELDRDILEALKIER